MYFSYKGGFLFFFSCLFAGELRIAPVRFLRSTRAKRHMDIFPLHVYISVSNRRRSSIHLTRLGSIEIVRMLLRLRFFFLFGRKGGNLRIQQARATRHLGKGGIPKNTKNSPRMFRLLVSSREKLHSVHISNGPQNADVKLRFYREHDGLYRRETLARETHHMGKRGEDI